MNEQATKDSFLLKCGGQLSIVIYDDEHEQELKHMKPTNILCSLYSANGDMVEVHLTVSDVKAMIYMLQDAVKRTSE